MASKQVIALLVGINNYGSESLYGCINDVNDVQSYLQSHCQNNELFELKSTVLLDDAATRSAIIDAFDLFEAAKEGDVCIFYFSGHGVRFDAREEFWSEDDKTSQALVCSGPNNGDNLLIDKELSYLIGRVTKDHNSQFIAITDCCHSGTNAKNGYVRYRSYPGKIVSKPAENYLGFDNYEKISVDGGKIRHVPVPGKHVKLSSCMDHQLSGEANTDPNNAAIQHVRGYFTYVLFQTLRAQKGVISYENLIAKIQILIGELTTDQTPFLSTLGTDPQSVFLGENWGLQEPVFQVWRSRLFGWAVKAGYIQGFNPDYCIEIQTPNGRKTLGIASVHQNYSVLKQLELLGLQDDIIDAKAIVPADKRLLVSIAPDCEPNGLAALIKYLEHEPSSSFSFDRPVSDRILFEAGFCKRPVSYTIRIKENAFMLTHPHDERPVFQRIFDYTEDKAALFVKRIDHVARWHQTVSIEAPFPMLGTTAVDVRLSEVSQPYNDIMGISSERIPIKDFSKGLVMRYKRENALNKRWHEPAIEIAITNKSDRKLWISGLYCGSGFGQEVDRTYSTLFGITNQFLPCTLLDYSNGSNTIYWQDILPNIARPNTNVERLHYTTAIQLSVLDDYFQLGLNEIKDQIKIFISEAELPAAGLEQNGLRIDTEEIERKKTNNFEKAGQRWQCVDIPVTIIRPREGNSLSDKPVAFMGVTLSSEAGLNARITYSTMEELVRTTAIQAGENAEVKCMQSPEQFWSEKNASIVWLCEGMGNAEGLAVIELHIDSYARQRKKAPLLTVQLENYKVHEKQELWLVAYCAERRAYLPLVKPDEKGIFQVHNLPAPSPVFFDGLGNSIKLFFLSADKDSLVEWVEEDTEKALANQ